MAGAGGVAFALVALLWAWDDGVVGASALLLVGYALSLAGGSPLDLGAPFVAAGLLGVVEFASWSLELRDGAEERTLGRLPAIAVLLFAALVASAVVLGAGRLQVDGGLGFWVVGAAGAIGLLALVATRRYERH